MNNDTQRTTARNSDELSMPDRQGDTPHQINKCGRYIL